MQTEPGYEETQFLNVDLDVFSRESLAPLVAALGERVFVLHEGRWGRRYSANVELAGNVHTKDADFLIKHLAALITKLPPSARRLWKRASAREFNIGIQGALKPRSFELRIKPETLAAAARLDARIVITVYAAEASAATAVTPRAEAAKTPPNKRMQLTRSATANGRRGPRS